MIRSGSFRRGLTVTVTALWLVAAGLFFPGCSSFSRLRQWRSLSSPDSAREAAIEAELPPVNETSRQETATAEVKAAEYAAVKAKLLAGAEAVLGKKPMQIHGRSFNLDCIGTVMAVYYYAGIDLSAEFYKYGGNGVRILYKLLEEKNLTYDTKLPSPGDIIFWDNTWDANGDGKWNDYLTHVGMVVKVEENGMVEFLHNNYRLGNVYARMNLKDPDTYYKILDGETIFINSPMRMKDPNKPRPAKWLSSHLYKIFGKGYMLEPANDT